MAKFCAWCGKQINGLDYQILVEADFLVNLYIGYIVDRAGSDEFFNMIFILSHARSGRSRPAAAPASGR